MGYCSDVRILVKTKDLEALSSSVRSHWTRTFGHPVGEPNPLLDDKGALPVTEASADGAESVVGWDYVKWYDEPPWSFDDVLSVMRALEDAAASGIPFVYCRIGEEPGDVDHRDESRGAFRGWLSHIDAFDISL